MATKEKKNYPESAESGQFIRSTMLDIDTRLRVARAIEKNETLASIGVFQMLKRRGHPDGPPPTISDGWGGIDEAMIEVYGLVPEYSGFGRPPTQKKPDAGWLYLQMVKQHGENGRFAGTKLKAIYGSLEELTQLLGETTAYIERSNLTSRLFNGRQVRKTLAFSKDVDCYRAAASWEDMYYNFVKPHKSLRQRVHDVPGCKWKPQTPAMTAHLTDHIWTVKELLTSIPLKCLLPLKGRLPKIGFPSWQQSRKVSRDHTGAYLYTSGVSPPKPLPRFTPGVYWDTPGGNPPVEVGGNRVIITNQEPDPMLEDLPENRYTFRFLPAPRA